MSALIIENDIVHYEVLGRGRPVLFLHSWVGSWRQWIQTMQSVSASYRAYALDLWGFGDSAKNGVRYSVLEQAALVDAFMEKLGIRKVAVVGHGLGALVAARFAAQKPAAVDRLMLAGIPYTKKMIDDRLSTAGSTDLSIWLLSGITGAEPVQQEAARADIGAVRASLAPAARDELMALTDVHAIPCLYVYADRDPAIPGDREATDPALDISPLAHQIELEDATHHPMVSRPGKFSRLVMDFLALDSGESPKNLQLKDEWKRRFR